MRSLRQAMHARVYSLRDMRSDDVGLSVGLVKVSGRNPFRTSSDCRSGAQDAGVTESLRSGSCEWQ